ncbi:MAG: glycerol-3-phosphate cytidylyltransferase [Alphaproteobacteria bacterium]|nr:glycerol-3-phosphate cytidylyltransferase [Alphaproteobacteria bacterium]
MIIGYTSGVYDLFHIGHLNLLRNAKNLCDKLIVAITTDEAALYKNKAPFIPQDERMEIVKAIKYVDEVVWQDDLDKIKAWEKYHYNKLFVGSDWKGSNKWINYEQELSKLGCEVVYLPYTQTTSSSIIQQTLKKFNNQI